MKTLLSRIHQRMSSTRAGLMLFFCLSMITSVMVFSPTQTWGWFSPVVIGAPGGNMGTVFTTAHGQRLSVQAGLSNTKFLQAGDDRGFLKITIVPPSEDIVQPNRQATDLVVVLDRSGSMAGENKMTYAKAAIQELLQRLNDQDRFALVSFDTHAVINAYLQPVTPSTRSRISEIVMGLSPGSSTNMSDGLSRAQSVLEASPSDRVKKIILLSDGQANAGITDPRALAEYAKNLGKSTIISTIGMGLDFNEVVLATLADYGMGHYSYLENLVMLGSVLEKDLERARSLYAQNSELLITLAPGIHVLDAGGYPFETLPANPRVIRIPTGQLGSGGNKEFVVTFKTPTDSLGDKSLGTIEFQVTRNGSVERVVVEKSQLAYAVIESNRVEEAKASFAPSIFKDAWLKNNVGFMRKEYSDLVREGKKDEARQKVADYRRQLKAAEQVAGIPIAHDKKVVAELGEMEQDLDSTFQGNAAEQEIKAKRLAKESLSKSRSDQMRSE